MVLKKIKGYPAPEFNGRVIRVLAHETVKEVDPFLMLDYFESDEKNMETGSWHPHRGIETFTYIVRGKMREKDTINGELEVDQGGALHLVSGSGMYHTGVPTYSENGIQGFQIWFNIPKQHKMDKPSSSAFQNNEFPHVATLKYDVKVLTGEYKGVKGPLDKSNLGLRILDVVVKDEISLRREIPKKGFIYVYEGIGRLNDTDVLEKQTAYVLEEGDYVFKNNGNNELRFLFAEGVPLKEPIAWRGPIVMNTQEELVKAFSELNNQTFIK